MPEAPRCNDRPEVDTLPCQAMMQVFRKFDQVPNQVILFLSSNSGFFIIHKDGIRKDYGLECPMSVDIQRINNRKNALNSARLLECQFLETKDVDIEQKFICRRLLIFYFICRHPLNPSQQQYHKARNASVHHGSQFRCSKVTRLHSGGRQRPPGSSARY